MAALRFLSDWVKIPSVASPLLPAAGVFLDHSSLAFTSNGS
jgi:hypothetical protein